jgi:hypothetical protein
MRAHGLKHRMPEPESFLGEINRLCIRMTHARGSKEAKKERKKVLRAMKRVVNVVQEHAERYRDLLQERWKEETDLSQKEAQQIINRMQGVLEQLPQAVKQAHERQEIFNGVCPRNPALLKQRLEEPKFVALQKRRSQTEGRIGIFKNVFLGRPMKAKGFENRQRSLAWAVMAHNLWVVVRLDWKEKAVTPQEKAA